MVICVDKDIILLSEKDILYRNATQKLLDTIAHMKLDPAEKDTAVHLTQMFRSAFQSPDVKKATLGPDIQEIGDTSIFRYDSEGFCRASSIAFANIINDKSNNWQVRYIDELWTFGPHHYLYHKPSKTVLDLTFDQFVVDGIQQIPYDMGRVVPDKYKNDVMAQRFIKAIKNHQANKE